MKNRDIYLRDPDRIILLNNGVAAMSDALSEDERTTLRFELEHFVCEGEYQRGLVRILESYVNNQDQPEQPAAWVSGFFGSGKSHLAKMLHFLWTDYVFPNDNASARGLCTLPDDVKDLLAEISTLGKRTAGLHAAAGTLGAGASDSVRLALLGIMFRSVGLPEGYPQASFCLWLKRNGLYEQVHDAVEAKGRDFRRELNDMYVSPHIADALLEADANFATDQKAARAALREQFPKPRDITTEELAVALKDSLAPDGEMPCTVIILDEVQQYIGEDASRSYTVQEVVETCSKRFGDRLLFLGTGQTALSGTPALQRLQGRFTVNVELSDTDVETVTRKVVLAKRPDRTNDIKSVFEAYSGELDRHLVGTGIGPRSEDESVLVDDYPLLPVRRRFWEHTLRAVDNAGMAGQLRTQLRMVYDAIRHTADEPLGTVVPADYLFEEQAPNLLQSGVLLREVNETIALLDDGSPEGKLKSRICSLIFLIRQLPREQAADIGVRATPETLADLLVQDLAKDGATLRGQIPQLLDELVSDSKLIKLDEEYSLQTRESSEWEAEFRRRQAKLINDPVRRNSKRTQMLGDAIQKAMSTVKLLQGDSREPRKLALHYSDEAPQDNTQEILVWIRDGWDTDQKSIVADARAEGSDSPTIHVFIPKSQAEDLNRLVAAESAARETIDYKGVPSSLEGKEAQKGMETRLTEAGHNLQALVAELVNEAKVFQGGGNERLEATLSDKVLKAANASLDRLFYEFKDADDNRWSKVIERARKGDEHPLGLLDYKGKTEDHPVCSAVLSCVGSGKKGRDIRAHFSKPPYGWPRDAIDAALFSLLRNGHLSATANGSQLEPSKLDQKTVSITDFRVESATIDTRQRIALRKIFNNAGIKSKPNEEAASVGEFLKKLSDLAYDAGGDAPLPERPDTNQLQHIQSLAGNEQLLEILNQQEELSQNIKDWGKMCNMAEKRMPAFQRLQSLADHAQRLDAAEQVKPQIEAIVKNRGLLEATDPIPNLAKMLTDALRSALTEAEAHFTEVYKEGLSKLETAESWQKISQSKRDRILGELTIGKITKGTIGTEQEVIESLGRISLDTWRTRTVAMVQLFAQARIQADKLVEPKTRHVKLESATLHTQDEVKEWLAKTERELLEQVKQGPVVVN